MEGLPADPENEGEDGESEEEPETSTAPEGAVSAGAVEEESGKGEDGGEAGGG
jgi:hypothetical protein